MSLARVLAWVRSVWGRAHVLGVLLALLTLVPLVHTSPPDAMWIAGIYDEGDFDDVVWALIGADSVVPPLPLTGTSPLLLVAVLMGVGVSSVVAGGSPTVRPRAPPRTCRIPLRNGAKRCPPPPAYSRFADRHRLYPTSREPPIVL